MAADHKVEIEIKTTADASGAEAVAEAVQKVVEVTHKGADSTAQKSTTAVQKTVEATEEALKSASEAGDQMLEGGKDALEEFRSDFQARMAALKEQLAKTGDEGGSDFVKELAEKLETGGAAAVTGFLSNPAVIATLAVGAASLGTVIGRELGKAITFQFQDGDWAGLISQTLDDLAVKAAQIGIASARAGEELRERVRVGLEEDLKAIQEWRDELGKPPANDSLKWLDDLKTRADAATEALRNLAAIQAAERRANMDKIGQDEAEALEDVDLDENMPESEKIKRRAEIRREAEQKRLEERSRGRSQEVERADAQAQLAERAVPEKERIAKAQEERAAMWAQIRSEAKQLATGNDGKVIESVERQQFKMIAEQRGMGDLEFDEDEKKKAEAARREADAAAKEAETARRNAAAVRERVGIEETSDREITARKMDRQDRATERTVQKQVDKEIEADPTTKLSEPTPDPLQDQVTAAGAELNRLAQATGDAGTKANLEDLKRKLEDGRGDTEAEIQAVLQMLEQIRQDPARASEALQQAMTAVQGISQQITELGQNTANGLSAAARAIEQTNSTVRAVVAQVERIESARNSLS